MAKRVAVIGAGVHGIAAAKTFMEHSHDVAVFEGAEDLGGVWRPGNNYPGLQLQSTADIYSYCDSGGTPRHFARGTEHPPAAAVYTYLRDYAAEHGVTPLIRFRTKLVQARPTYDRNSSSGTGGVSGGEEAEEPAGATPTGWHLTLRRYTGPPGEPKDAGPWEEFDHNCDVLLICIGCFNVPKTPPFPGQSDFVAGGGVVVHSSQLQSLCGGRQAALEDVAVMDAALAADQKAAEERSGGKGKRGAGGGAGKPETHVTAAATSATTAAVVQNGGTSSAGGPGPQHARPGSAEAAVLAAASARLAQLVSGKRVVVVGNGKSGEDVAVLMADTRAAKSVTCLYKEPQWSVPYYLLGLVNFKYPLTTRLGDSITQKLHAPPGLLGWLHRAVGWSQWRLIERLVSYQHGRAKLGVVPTHAVERGLDCTLHAEPFGFFTAAHEGRLQLRQGQPVALGAGGRLQLDDGAEMQADLVVLATGWGRSLPFLPPDLASKIMQPDGTLQLHHGIYPYEIGGSSLFILGWNVGLFQALFADVAARWALEMVEGRLRVTKEQMLAYRTKLFAWADRCFIPRAAADIRRGCVAAYSYEHVDDMLKEMGADFKSLTMAEYLQLYMTPVNAALYGKAMRAINTGSSRSR
ncbi:hypothetical protein CHLRE_03g168900v5 [Chlamydomonas reinhardtii]|uniref:Flavin-containing monooxygenase n=1 Tax=Chlamydomonas reinhardtii TaxID=3055 RepID=A0A2K3DWX6_CHLRE|nr:uncharacterized protein CHLRE_03g168900v5 [Chlamydomonas reinhardtii]PNW85035.1 hypothetical protein CHLRE_03g168900v5 [Chlamydomonas reinhardtii]